MPPQHSLGMTLILWPCSAAWHLWRLLTLRPVQGTLGNTQRAETMIIFVFAAAGILRHFVLGPDPIGVARLAVVVLSMGLYAWLCIVIVSGVMRAYAKAFNIPDAKDFEDIACLIALGSSAAVDLVASGLILGLGDVGRMGLMLSLAVNLTWTATNLRSFSRQARLSRADR